MKKKVIIIFFILTSVLAFAQVKTYTLSYQSNREKIFFIENNNYTSVYFYSKTDTLKYKYFLNKVPAPPNIIYQDDDFFILLQVAGTYSAYWDVFQKHFQKQSTFFNPLALDKKNKLIAYQPYERQVYIATFNNQIIDSTKINIKFAYLDYYIDKAFFWNNGFYVLWNENVANSTDGLPQYKPGQYSKIFSLDTN